MARRLKEKERMSTGPERARLDQLLRIFRAFAGQPKAGVPTAAGGHPGGQAQQAWHPL